MCLRYINADPDPDQVAVQAARDELQRCVTKIIERLSWHDFEALVDLILQRSGWLRVSALGGMLEDVDLIVEQPRSRECAKRWRRRGLRLGRKLINMNGWKVVASGRAAFGGYNRLGDMDRLDLKC